MKYLLSWHGITDLRSALGLEPSGGPLLAALKTGEYDEAVILSYVDPQKEISPAQSCADEIDAKREAIAALPVGQQFGKISPIMNTSLSLRTMESWLQSQMNEHRIATRISMVAAEMDNLLDSEQIYNAASMAFEKVYPVRVGTVVTLYLSPGTPVMAFCWALLAMQQQEMRIRLLASSDPSQPPLEVKMPTGLGPRR